MSALRVVLCGAQGRMGRLVAPALRDAADLELAATLVRDSHADAVLAESDADVLLDFTHADVARRIGPAAARRGIRPVIGSSGLTPSDRETLAAACREGGVGGLLVPNFSVGAVLQMRLAETVARHLDCRSIHEVHHPGKRDAPSGTARATAERIAAARTGGDAVDGPPITSERAPGVLARQTVTFAGTAETLALHHDVTDRSAYLPGILLALRRVGELDRLVVGLDALLPS